MATTTRPRTALQLIFAFFLGLMVTAFIGIGVYTFYPDGNESFDDQRQEYFDRQSDVREARAADGFTAEQQAELDAVEEELRQLEKESSAHMQRWARNTSIILIIFATIAMGVSLVRADQLPVISNGLLLGGVFTMLYGTGWTIASGDSMTRFFVMTAALLVTLGLGYVRFVRERGASSAGAPDAPSGVDDLARRVEALERRVEAAAEAMRQP